jgi:hypothetical protein
MTGPAFTPIDWRSIRDTIWEWFTEMSGCETIWADQSAPQPAYPYASLNILPGSIEFGALDEERIQSDGSLLLVGERDFVLSCQIHIGPECSNDPSCDARMRADCVVASLALPQVRNLLGSANLGLRERGQPQMLDLVIGTEWIKRAQVDIRFGTMSEVAIADWPNLSDPGWFNKVSISSDIQPLQGAGGLNLDDELLDPTA